MTQVGNSGALVVALVLMSACNRSGLAVTPGSTENTDAASRICRDEPFPGFDASCISDTDCIAVEHQINCCGTLAVMGIRFGERARFDGAEAMCRAGYPGCGCAQLPTQTDDGSLLSVGETAGVACFAGSCRTFRRACGAPCSAGRVCLSCSVHLSEYAACSAECTSDADCGDPKLPSCLPGTTGLLCAAAGTACGTK